MDTSLKQFLNVSDFCESHGISRGHFYRLLKDGLGPDIVKIGKRTLISVESAARWRRRMEQQSAQEQ